MRGCPTSVKRDGSNWSPACGRQISRAPHNCLPDRPAGRRRPALRWTMWRSVGTPTRSPSSGSPTTSQIKEKLTRDFPLHEHRQSTQAPRGFGSAAALWLPAGWPSPLWGWRPPRRRRRYPHPPITITGAPATTGTRAGVPTPTGTTATTGTTTTARGRLRRTAATVGASASAATVGASPPLWAPPPPPPPWAPPPPPWAP